MTTERINEIKGTKNIFLKIILDNFEIDNVQRKAFERFVKAFDELFDNVLDNTETKEIATIANECRTAQRSYFATRTPKHLNDAKILESELDMKIQEILNHERVVRKPTAVQTQLFS